MLSTGPITAHTSRPAFPRTGQYSKGTTVMPVVIIGPVGKAEGSVVRWCVVTGAPRVGEDLAAAALQERYCSIVAEAATDVIARKQADELPVDPVTADTP